MLEIFNIPILKVSNSIYTKSNDRHIPTDHHYSDTDAISSKFPIQNGFIKLIKNYKYSLILKKYRKLKSVRIRRAYALHLAVYTIEYD